MNGPELSVVIPSVNGWGDLEGCLEALEVERRHTAIEVVIPERCGESVRSRLADRFPWATVLPVGPATGIPAMRAVAFDHASASSVAVIEDHVVVPPGWAHDLLLARGTAQVAGGAIRNGATDSLVDWAAFLCEYSHALPPLAAGPSRWLTGNNTVYDRALLERYREVTHAGRWEDHFHGVLRQEGIPLICHPEIIVDHRKHYSVGEYVRQRYLFSRSYAGERAAGRPAWHRIAAGLAAIVALPPLLLGRIVTRSLRKQVAPAIVWRSVPLLLLFVSAWGVGEGTGYWFGPGDALARVC